LRPRHPRDATVEAVEHHRHEDRRRGLVEAQIHRLHDRIETREQRRRREEIREQVDAAPAHPVLAKRALGVEVGHI